eukprot:3175873-Alexandrium_andersonii.AAC.1
MSGKCCHLHERAQRVAESSQQRLEVWRIRRLHGCTFVVLRRRGAQVFVRGRRSAGLGWC